MLSDRSYMRTVSGRPNLGFLAWFLGVLAGVFVLQKVSEAFFNSFALLDHGALSSSGLRRGEIWRPFTYALLHGSPIHLLLNGLGLFFIGRYLQETLGSVRLAWLTFAGAVGGALVWLAFHFTRAGVVIGASGIAMTYLSVFACLNPRRPITVLLFFIIPITIQPMWLVAIIGGIDVLGLITQELPASGSLYGVAHSAHLGGLLAGWIFYRLVLAPRRGGTDPIIEPPSWLKKQSRRPVPAYTVNLDVPAAGSGSADASPVMPSAGARDALRVEVDRILDKINLDGFGSLTAEEKRVLDQARHHLSHR